jgi:hypothetical protein
MMFCAARGAPRPVAPVGSHPLPTMPMTVQSHSATPLSRTVAACPHVL